VLRNKFSLRFSHHFVVQLFFLIHPGGFRFASTTGYYLPALRAEARQQLFGLLLKLEFANNCLLLIAVQGTILPPRR
jgi:hypothetical protein